MPPVQPRLHGTEGVRGSDGHETEICGVELTPKKRTQILDVP